MLAPNAVPSIFKAFEAHLQMHECHIRDTQTAHTAAAPPAAAHPIAVGPPVEPPTPLAPPALTSVASSTNDHHKFNIIHDHNYLLPGSAKLKRVS